MFGKKETEKDLRKKGEPLVQTEQNGVRPIETVTIQLSWVKLFNLRC